MKQFVKERLENYLEGTLSSRQEAELRDYLRQHPEDEAELALYAESSKWLKDLRAPEDVELSGDFYARVMQRVEEQRSVPFWMFFLQPAFARRLAFGGLIWLAMLGGYVASFDSIWVQPAREEGMASNRSTDAPWTDFDASISSNSMSSYAMNQRALLTADGALGAYMLQYSMINQPPSSEFKIRLGSDIDQNRNSMLAVLMEGD